MKKQFKTDPIKLLLTLFVIVFVFVAFILVFLISTYERFFSTAPPVDITSYQQELISPSTQESTQVTDLPSDGGTDTSYAEPSGTSDTSAPEKETPEATTPNREPDKTEAPQVTEQTTPKPDETTSPPEDNNKKYVALTFDDGPHAEYTEELLAILEKYNAKATFFVLGTNIKGEARINALKKTAEGGHEIANHTFSHPTVLKITVDELVREIDKGADRIYETIGVRPTLVRTPGGKFNAQILAKMKYPLIHWTVDTRDWEHNDPEITLQYVKDNLRDGGIILMHDRKSAVADATELIIKWLYENDYEVVTVSELMRIKGTPLEAGKVYFSATNIR